MVPNKERNILGSIITKVTYPYKLRVGIEASAICLICKNLHHHSLRYEKEGKPSELAPIDIFVSTVDPMKEPPLITANTVLSILAVDYPVDKVSCYVSDDGAAMLTFEALTETCLFARKWVPFCKKYKIEPRAPEWYFAQKIDYLREKVPPEFVRERRAMKVSSYNRLMKHDYFALCLIGTACT